MKEIQNEGTILVVIDKQKDFMTTPKGVGSLSVPGAYEDTLRVCNRIRTNPPAAIVATLDTHAELHIAHPIWWVNAEGKNPDLYTIITVADVESGKWKAADPEMEDYSKFYVKQLAEQGKYKLQIWPFHCIKGTEGHQVVDVLAQAFQEWEEFTGNKVTYVCKGTNPKTEHYSVFKAEVVLEEDSNTKLNIDLIKKINSYERSEWVGQASSHCLGGSALDYMNNIPPSDIAKVTILKDCTSPVQGFEADAQKFFQKAAELGATVTTAEPAKKLKM